MDKQNIFYNLANAVFILRIPKGKTFKISLVYWYWFIDTFFTWVNLQLLNFWYRRHNEQMYVIVKLFVFIVLLIIHSQDKTKAVAHTIICKKFVNKISIQNLRFHGGFFE